MRRSKSPSGKMRLYFAEREIESMCLEALKDSGCLPDEPDAIEIDFFLEKHFDVKLDVGTDTETETGVLGFTLFSDTGKPEVVGVTSSLFGSESPVDQRRARSTLAHEGGHCLMHSILFASKDQGSLNDIDNAEQNRILCRRSDMNAAGGYDGRWWEFQANRAIGNLLLPRKLVRDVVTPFEEPEGKMGLTSLRNRRGEAIREVSSIFDVNPKVAEIRLGELHPEPQGQAAL